VPGIGEKEKIRAGVLPKMGTGGSQSKMGPGQVPETAVKDSEKATGKLRARMIRDLPLKVIRGEGDLLNNVLPSGF